METRQLFGGAIDAQLPSRFQDVSDFRPVPNNQEASFRCGRLDEGFMGSVHRLQQMGCRCGQMLIEISPLCWTSWSVCKPSKPVQPACMYPAGAVCKAADLCCTALLAVQEHSAVPDDAAVVFYFQDLAEQNEAVQSQLQMQTPLGEHGFSKGGSLIAACCF